MAIKQKLHFFISTLFSTKVFFPLLILFYLLNFFFNGEPFVRSDGFCYYQISKSIINERNFISTNEPEYWDYMGHVKETFNGNYISVCTPGTSLAILPGLAVANLFKGNANIHNDFFIAYNGHTFAEGLSILISAAVFSILSWILIYKSLRLLGFSERNSWFSILAVFLSSYALWYVFILPAFTHTYEIFSVSLLLYSFIKIQQQKTQNLKIFFLCGLASGFTVITRPTLLPLVILVCLGILIQKHPWKKMAVIVLAGLPFLFLYLSYNYISYGNVFAIGYSTVRNESFNLSHSYIFELLFSPLKGWFVFSPIYLFSVSGLILFYKKNRSLSLICLIGIFSIALIYSFWSQWWGGGSYGSRFMCFALPIGSIGLANFINYIKDKKQNIKIIFLSLIVIFVFFSTAILFLYRVVDVNGSWFYSPFFLFKTELNILKEVHSPSDLFRLHYQAIYEGSGILKLTIQDFPSTITVIETDNKDIEIKLFTPPNGINYSFPQNLTFNKLPYDEFTGITLLKNQIKIYIERNKNIVTRGNLIPLSNEETEYVLTN